MCRSNVGAHRCPRAGKGLSAASRPRCPRRPQRLSSQVSFSLLDLRHAASHSGSQNYTVDSVDLIISEIHLTKMEGPRARVGADGTALLRVTGTIVTRAAVLTAWRCRATSHAVEPVQLRGAGGSNWRIAWHIASQPASQPCRTARSRIRTLTRSSTRRSRSSSETLPSTPCKALTGIYWPRTAMSPTKTLSSRKLTSAPDARLACSVLLVAALR
jgi:hypothetical protein